MPLTDAATARLTRAPRGAPIPLRAGRAFTTATFFNERTDR